MAPCLRPARSVTHRSLPTWLAAACGVLSARRLSRPRRVDPRGLHAFPFEHPLMTHHVRRFRLFQLAGLCLGVALAPAVFAQTSTPTGNAALDLTLTPT